MQEGAFVEIVVKLGLVKLHSQKVDICEQARQAKGIECPIPAGEYSVKEEVTVSCSEND